MKKENDMKRLSIFLGILCLVVGLSIQAPAHTPLCSCWDNGDGTITCEGGFSDGSSASGVRLVVTKDGRDIVEGQMDEYSEFTFDKPEGSYTVIFDAGEGHAIEVKGKDIF
jgi:hypothetical protein